MSYYSDKITEIKQKLQAKKTVPAYEPEKWEINGTPIFTNCYAYCLDLDVTDPETSIFIPGSIADEHASKTILSVDTLVANIHKDLDFLGIAYRKNKGLLNSGEYRIGIYTGYVYGNQPISVHFVRQDNDNKWSEKFGWTGSILREVDIASKEPKTCGWTGCKFLFDSLILKLPTF